MDWTLENIIKVVDESKDLTRDEQIKIAYSMPRVAGSLFVAHMQSRHNISVPI